MIAGDVRSLARQYCAAGTRVQYQQYDATSHFTTVPLWLPSAISWLDARLAGTAAPSNCASIPAGNSLAPLATGLRLSVAVTPRRAVLHRAKTVTVRVTANVGGTASPVPDATVLIGNGQHLLTNTAGMASARLRYGRTGRRRVLATAGGYAAGATVLTVSR
jgi:hypothetical protein